MHEDKLSTIHSRGDAGWQRKLPLRPLLGEQHARGELDVADRQQVLCEGQGCFSGTRVELEHRYLVLSEHSGV